MKLFDCQSCGQMLFFENTRCERCGRALGFLPESLTLSALDRAGDDWQALAAPDAMLRFCANAAHDACNWMLPADARSDYCLACRHNTMVPDLSLNENLRRWQAVEAAKHRLIYALLRLRLPLATRAEDPEHGLSFVFLADPPAGDAPRVMTGHDNGVITLAVSEAEPAQRESLRLQMGETYRTLLGHFRHEVGHHYWDLLVRDGGRLDRFRAVFGDERADYDAALQRHYAAGAPADWQQTHISAYATAHPWEDFAETWAHYLHIVDTLETARAFGLRIRPEGGAASGLRTAIDFDAYEADAGTLLDSWLPLTFAVNSLNRSMGQPDLYPFVLSPPVIDKLQFIRDVVKAAGAAPAPAPDAGTRETAPVR